MFHLITHAFFKALLFMGAGSVIHGCHDEQDIRNMGDIKKYMPVTFATYAVGMLALAGFPLVFSGFWSKDAILHSAHGWSVSHIPFYLGVAGAFLTAFYMTRQVALVFFGNNRSAALPSRSTHDAQVIHDKSHAPHASGHAAAEDSRAPHESPRVMTVPLIILAACAIGLSVIGTPAWPWFQTFLGQHHGEGGFTSEVISLLVISSLVVFAGLGIGWWLYGCKPIQKADEPDVLEKLPLGMHTWFAKKYGVDELYELTVIRFNAWFAKACAFLDQWVWGGAVQLANRTTRLASWNRGLNGSRPSAGRRPSRFSSTRSAGRSSPIDSSAYVPLVPWGENASESTARVFGDFPVLQAHDVSQLRAEGVGVHGVLLSR
jgi:NADH-quinone oxidoreductase subunit L